MFAAGKTKHSKDPQPTSPRVHETEYMLLFLKLRLLRPAVLINLVYFTCRARNDEVPAGLGSSLRGLPMKK
jgi:hypothetical protein